MQAAIMLETSITTDRRMPGTDDDAELIRQIAAGDEHALRRLYAACGQRLYAYALRLTGDPAKAEDVVQDSLVAIWQGAGRFRGDGRAIAWVLGIVHHKALNALRARSDLFIEAAENDLPAGGPPPDEQAAANDRRRMLREGLGQLSLEHRVVLELVFYQRLSLDEAAEVIGCPVGTIKSRLNYAKAHLRGVLRLGGLEPEDAL